MKLSRILLAFASGLAFCSGAAAQTISFTGTALSQNFDGMGATGTNTPAGWFVGSNAATVINYTTNVTVSAGAVANGGAIRGFNFGATNDAERALGTAPTASNRYLEARLRNNTIFGLNMLTVTYDGEEWRTGNNSLATNANRLVLQYSADGTNYADMGAAFNFTQLVDAPQASALDGNAAANRTAGLGGAYTPDSVVLPGGAIFLRWFDNNELQTDPALAIDNFAFAATLTNLPVVIAIASPTNGQTFPFSADVPVTTTASGSVSNVAFFVDGTFVSTDATAPFTATVPTALLPEGTHNLQAIATNAVGDITASAVVSILITPNQPPTIALTNGVTEVLAGTAITNLALLTDDVGVTNVQWFVDGVSRFNRGTPFTFVYNDPVAGLHTIEAIATDRGGLPSATASIMVNVTNPPANFIRLLTNGSDWKYYGNTAEPPADGGALAWFQGGYDDSGWSNGVAELGNGDVAGGYPESTLINIGPTGNRYRTIYFRKTFTSPDPLDFGQVVLRLLRDDGAVVHLNGQPVWTNNIPAATNGLTYATLAATAADEGTVYQVTGISADSLFEGENTVAVEVHQTSAGSSDLSFDLMIWGEIPTLPVVAILSPTNGQSFIETSAVTVNAIASTFVTDVTLLVGGNPYGSDNARPFSIVVSNLGVGPHTLVARAVDQFTATADSAPVTIFITPNQPPVIALTNVASVSTGFVFLVGSAITNQYGVSDDLGVTNVDFLIDGVLRHRDAAGFGQVVVNDALAGVHTYTAIAYDRLGATAASSVMVTVTNPPNVTLLLTNGADWNYEDSGLTQAVDWVTLAFDDSGWSNGAAELGFGDAADDVPERTVLRRNSGLLDTNGVIFYFRKVIDVTDPAVFTNVIVKLLRDDGARLWLNGQAVFTSPATYPPTAAAGDDGTVYATGNVSPTNLVAGLNLVAVEVRQNNAGSSDISFDLMLWGQGPSGGPPLTITLINGGADVRLTWNGGGTLECTDDLADPGPGNWQPVNGAASPYETAASAAHRFYRVRVP